MALTSSPEEEVNFLLGIALENIAFIAFSYLVDKFRLKIFDGTISKITYNQEWWNFRGGRWLPSKSEVLMSWEPEEARQCMLFAVTKAKTYRLKCIEPAQGAMSF